MEENNGGEHKERPFRFEKVCISMERCEAKIEEDWHTYFVEEGVSNVAQKIACMGEWLKFWSLDYFSHVGHELKRAQKEMK